MKEASPVEETSSEMAGTLLVKEKDPLWPRLSPADKVLHGLESGEGC